MKTMSTKGSDRGKPDLLSKFADEMTIPFEMKPLLKICLNLNHEISNPLTGIIGFSEALLMETELTETQAEYVEQILRCADRIRTQIELVCREKIDLVSRSSVRPSTESPSATGKEQL